MKKITFLAVLGFGLLFGPAATPSLSAAAYISPSDTVTQAKLKNDTDLTWAVRNAIATDNRFLAYADGIHVETKDGVVTLTGIVDSQKTKSDIEVSVKSISGVKKVINNILLKTIVK